MSEALDKIKQAIKESKEAGDAIELNLQSIKFERFTPEIRAAIEELKELEVLILIDCGLTTLENFTNQNFHAIDLTQNKYIFVDEGSMMIAKLKFLLIKIISVNCSFPKIKLETLKLF